MDCNGAVWTLSVKLCQDGARHCWETKNNCNESCPLTKRRPSDVTHPWLHSQPRDDSSVLQQDGFRLPCWWPLCLWSIRPSTSRTQSRCQTEKPARRCISLVLSCHRKKERRKKFSISVNCRKLDRLVYNRIQHDDTMWCGSRGAVRNLDLLYLWMRSQWLPPCLGGCLQ